MSKSITSFTGGRAPADEAPDHFRSIVKIFVGGGRNSTPKEKEPRETTQRSSQASAFPEAAQQNNRHPTSDGQNAHKIQVFWMHEAPLVQRSHFFAMALNGNWKESDEKIVVLPDDDPEIFKLYLGLIFTNRVYVVKKKAEDVDYLAHSEHEYGRLCELYILAEKLQDATSKNLLIDAILARSRQVDGDGMLRYPNSGIVAMVYDNTPESSPLRRLLVDFYADHWVTGWVLDAETPKDFFVDLVKQVLAVRPLPREENTTQTCDPKVYYCEEVSMKKRKHSEDATDGMAHKKPALGVWPRNCSSLAIR
ncbi:hypothetical protein CC80DRAFT_598274 [Byssothecium circinans]|uniref:BTB domain-containing protein n=1 Tax=Byssothecium circinans TaxID=147558 RepID=A0A6A5TF18_9PLEO|nr:hypothetical protein CC80DRAFT_598274 [Byssothecium circinans]